MNRSTELLGICVHDIDECLVNSIARHFEYTPLVAKQWGLSWPEAELPTYEELLAKGGTNLAYGHFPKYHEVNEFLRNDAAFNTNLEPIDGALEALKCLSEVGYFNFYLTTRPLSLSQATLNQLVGLGFPEGRVIARPENVLIERTSEWKLSVLEATYQAHGRPLVMIDDSIGMAQTILKRNHSKIGSILYKGPVTPRGNGELDWAQTVDLLLNSGNWDDLRSSLTGRTRA